MNNKIHVSLVFTSDLCSGHVSICLVQEVDNQIKWYSIDPYPYSENSNKKASILEKKTLEKYRNRIKEVADEVIEFEIDGDIDEIILSWANHPPFNACFNNCADSAAWFLNTYANIPNPGACSRPVSCNQIFCCFFAPSYLQPCTTPGRVADYTRSALREQRRSVTDNPASMSMIREPLLICSPQT